MNPKYMCVCVCVALFVALPLTTAECNLKLNSCHHHYNHHCLRGFLWPATN